MGHFDAQSGRGRGSEGLALVITPCVRPWQVYRKSSITCSLLFISFFLISLNLQVSLPSHLPINCPMTVSNQIATFTIPKMCPYRCLQYNATPQPDITDVSPGTLVSTPSNLPRYIPAALSHVCRGLGF